MGKDLKEAFDLFDKSQELIHIDEYFEAGAKFAQEKICEPKIIQKIRATKSDAEARRIIRTLLK